MTILEIALGLYCYVVPWAMTPGGLNGNYECHPQPGGTVQMLVVKQPEGDARVFLDRAEWRAPICDGWCDQ